jgi:8-oxo-dGTP pyrophosphatase MutT (NUDIX family)
MVSVAADLLNLLSTSGASLPSRLQRRLQCSLPGRSAQALMEPGAAFGRHFGPPRPDVREAAVLVLLYSRDGAWHVVLTQRHADLATHAGQVSLPGGLVEAGESVRSAAQRELQEELGVPARLLTPLGELSPVYLFATHFHITPCVAWANATPLFTPNPSEVAALLEVPLTDLFDSRLISRHRRRVRGVSVEAPHYFIAGLEVWGATAMILSEFVVACREALSDSIV